MSEPILPEDGVFRIVKAGWYQVSLTVRPGGQVVSEMRLISADEPPHDDVDRIVQQQMREDEQAYTHVQLTADSPEPDSTPGDLWIDDSTPTDFLVRQLSGWLWTCNQTETLQSLAPHESWAQALSSRYGTPTIRRPTVQEKARYYSSSE